LARDRERRDFYAELILNVHRQIREARQQRELSFCGTVTA
jgi:hypothetical protein